MINKILPIVLIFIGLGAGVGAGVALRKPQQDVTAADIPGEYPPTAVAAEPEEAAEFEVMDFIKLPDQFVVPVVESGRVKALVVMSLTLEVSEPQEEAIFSRLPKLRDGFLRVILDHANTGGFDDNFTSNGSMDSLRSGFMDVARNEFPSAIHDVLILDINRQDLG